MLAEGQRAGTAAKSNAGERSLDGAQRRGATPTALPAPAPRRAPPPPSAPPRGTPPPSQKVQHGWGASQKKKVTSELGTESKSFPIANSAELLFAGLSIYSTERLG